MQGQQRGIHSVLVVDPVVGQGGIHIPRQGPRYFADGGYCGRSFNQGLLRFHDATTAPLFRAYVVEGFAEIVQLDPNADVLAFDWQGRQYLTALPAGATEVQIIRADIGRGVLEDLGPEQHFTTLLQAPGLYQYLDGERYDQWRAATGNPSMQLAFTDCVELVRPTYAAGQDNIDNMDVRDMDVSWGVGVQIRPAILQLIEQGVDVSTVSFTIRE